MDTIVAISTPSGAGGIAVIRLSGPDALAIADKVWKGRPLAETPSHTTRLGTLTDRDGDPVDRCLATVFRAPNSFTGEDTVEFSLHGSRWIQRKALEVLMSVGAAPAKPGEFTQRAFINGKMDLAQAEGVADLIASSSRAAHTIALRQMDGSFSRRLDRLRTDIVELASLLELELDFSEEEVEFADRKKLSELTDSTLDLMKRLADTYSAGKAFKEGVPVVIAGAPNAGKSTLLNALLQSDKAIVSDVPGTTRDIVEDTIEINGILFRFLDTAGLRTTEDRVESIGIERAREALQKAAIVLWLIDPTAPCEPQSAQLCRSLPLIKDAKLIIVETKADLRDSPASPDICGETAPETFSDIPCSCGETSVLRISAATGTGMSDLIDSLTTAATAEHNPQNELIITNARHYSELCAAADALTRVRSALDTGLSADLIAQDVREATHHLATLTGAITTDSLLASIFANFCIGK